MNREWEITTLKIGVQIENLAPMGQMGVVQKKIEFGGWTLNLG